jgi:hypothetical protein
MKKAILGIFIVIGLMSTIFALSGVGIAGNPDDECTRNGYEFGIVKYECPNEYPAENGTYLDDPLAIAYNISLKWEFDSEELEKGKYDCVSANWTSNPAVDALISFEGGDVFVHSGGTDGTIFKDDTKAISHISFCGNGDYPMVPEFGFVVGLITILGAVGVFFFVRK